MGWIRSREARLGILSMALLVFQGTALSLTLRYSRTRAGRPYLASVAVIYTELIKLLICIGAQARECLRTANERDHTVVGEIRHQAEEILGKSFPMFVPAALFVMQQVLVIIAASHLDAVTFQICSQSFKILPTAFFAVWLLGQYLTPMQWASLPMLVIGVIFVTVNGSTPKPAGTAVTGAPSVGEHLMLGLGASALSGLSSAYAGVYFEKYVKGKLGQTLWIRNLQLSIYGVPLAIMYSIIKDGSVIREAGFHQGFNLLVWSVVALQVFGGLIVGMVVKYADNILKNFANALSVIFTVLGAVPLFGQYPSLWFVLGIGGVMMSVFMYSGAIPDPGLEACVKQVTWSNTYLLLSCEDCAGSGRKRGTLDSGPGLSPATRRLLRGILLSMALCGLLLLTLVGRQHDAQGMSGHPLGRRGGIGMTAGAGNVRDPKFGLGTANPTRIQELMDNLDRLRLAPSSVVGHVRGLLALPSPRPQGNPRARSRRRARQA